MSDRVSVTVGLFHAGSAESLVVLKDWRKFFADPSPPLYVMTIKDHPGNFEPEDVQRAWPGARVDTIGACGLGLPAIEPAAFYEIVAAAETEWLLMIKLDVLPHCDQPDPEFLAKIIERVKRSGAWGSTGSFIPPDLSRNNLGEPVTARYSNNYSMFRPTEWLKAIESHRPAHVQAVRERKLTPESRFVTEAAIEEFLSQSGERLLFLEDTPERYVFHVNQWEQRLLEVREKFLRQEGIDPFMNTYTEKQREPWTYPAWERYYGWPRLSMARRLWIKLGAWRRWALS